MNLNEFSESMTCSECGGPAFSDLLLAEKKDACYNKVRSRYKVWPSAYASGALVQCRKKGAANWGNKSEGVAEGMAGMDDAEPYTIGGAVDKQYVYTVMRDGKSMGIYHSLDDAKSIVANNKRTNKYSEFKIQRKPRSKMAGPVGQLPEQGVAEGSEAQTQVKEILKAIGRAQQERKEWKRRGYDTAELDQDVRNLHQSLKHAERAWDRMSDKDVAEGNNPVDHEWYRKQQERKAKAAKRQDQQQKQLGVAEGQLDEKCWDTHRQAGMKKKGDRMVPNCVPKESIEEDNMNEYNPEYDDEAGMADNNLETLQRAVEGIDDLIQSGDNLPEWCQEKIAVAKSMLVSVWDYMYSEEASDEVDPEIDAMFEAMQGLVLEMAQKNRVSEDLVWETFEAMPDNVLYETAAWRRKEGKSKKGGLNAKGVASYRRENPGSKLQMAVTTKPSKLKPGSKAAKRRKSFCARMSGVKGPMKKPNGKPTRKALALRKWNC